MLKHLHPQPRSPARVVVLGAHGFIAARLQAWCAREAIACRAVSSAQVDLTQPDGAAKLAALLRPDDALVLASSVPPDKGRDYRALMANLRMAETAIAALEKTACSQVVCLSSEAVYD